jgi:hypothetical protein
LLLPRLSPPLQRWVRRWMRFTFGWPSALCSPELERGGTATYLAQRLRPRNKMQFGGAHSSLTSGLLAIASNGGKCGSARPGGGPVTGNTRCSSVFFVVERCPRRCAPALVRLAPSGGTGVAEAGCGTPGLVRSLARDPGHRLDRRHDRRTVGNPFSAQASAARDRRLLGSPRSPLVLPR